MLTCLRVTPGVHQATKVLARSRGTPPQSSVVSREIDSIKATVQARPLPLRRALESRGVQRALLLGCGLQALQQAMGINTVMCDAKQAPLPPPPSAHAVTALSLLRRSPHRLAGTTLAPS